jgi:hypothetical protein
MRQHRIIVRDEQNIDLWMRGSELNDDDDDDFPHSCDTELNVQFILWYVDPLQENALTNTLPWIRVINKHFLGHGYAILENKRTEFGSIVDRLEEKSVIVRVSRSSDQNGESPKQSFIVSHCNWLWLTEIVREWSIQSIIQSKPRYY